MKRLRIILAAVIVAALCLTSWQAFFQPRTVGALPAAPTFKAVLYGKNSEATCPDDYARRWIWLVFSGKD